MNTKTSEKTAKGNSEPKTAEKPQAGNPVHVNITDTVENDIEKRIEANNRLTECLEKLSRLKESARKLQSFKVSGDEVTTQLRIFDRTGNSFEVNKSDIINEVVSLIGEKLEKKVSEVQKTILSIQV